MLNFYLITYGQHSYRLAYWINTNLHSEDLVNLLVLQCLKQNYPLSIMHSPMKVKFINLLDTIT